jgi:4-amino-4-deoxy-L-arabinose transferase-like glycosyltransferase
VLITKCKQTLAVWSKLESVMSKSIRYYFLLILFCAGIFIPGLSRLPVVDADEARFVQASKQMLETNNFTQINFQTTPRHLKPPGIYWLQSGFTRLFNIKHIDSVWSYRLPSALGGTLAALLLFALFYSCFENEVTGFLAAATLASSLLLVVESHMGTTDAALLGCMVLMQGSLWQVFRCYRTHQASGVWPWIFWLGMALGIFIKGTSPIIGLLTILGICIVDRSVNFLRRLHFASGFALLVALSMLWLWPISQHSSTNFLWDMIHKDALPKVFGSAQGHGAPPGYFLIMQILMFWPSSILTFRALVGVWQSRHHMLAQFLLAWLLPCWLFIELVHTKLPEYALPIFPVLAIAIAQLLEFKPLLSRRWQFAELMYRLLWCTVGIVLAVAIPMVAHVVLGCMSLAAVVFSLLVLSMTVLAFYFSQRDQVKQCLLVCIVMSLPIYACLTQFILPDLKPVWLSQRISRVVKQQGISLSAKAPLYSSGFTEPSLVFALGTHNVRFVSEAQLLAQLKKSQIIYGLVDRKFWSALQQQVYGFQVLDKIDGFNYERGKWRHLILIRRKKNEA